MWRMAAHCHSFPLTSYVVFPPKGGCKLALPMAGLTLTTRLQRMPLVVLWHPPPRPRDAASFLGLFKPLLLSSVCPCSSSYHASYHGSALKVRYTGKIFLHSRYSRWLPARGKHDDIQSTTWYSVNPISIRNFSAVCWYTGRTLFDALGGDVPVGLAMNVRQLSRKVFATEGRSLQFSKYAWYEAPSPSDVVATREITLHAGCWWTPRRGLVGTERATGLWYHH